MMKILSTLSADGRRAERVFQMAVAEAIEEHRRMKVPVAIWKDGKVVTISASRIRIPREIKARLKANRWK